MQPFNSVPNPNQQGRIRIWYALLIVIGLIFIGRLFYLQVLRHNYYQQAAYNGQYEQYHIPAERGTIAAHDGDKVVPIVLNEKLYTLFVDPKYIKDAKVTSQAIAQVIGGNSKAYEAAMHTSSRYVILGKKLTPDQQQQINKLAILGVGTRASEYRTYPQGQLASQLLGFVNDDGQGKYGVEQAMQSQLVGTPGELKAITDAKGVPLVANKDNVSIAPKPGQNLLLTIDISMQQQIEDILKQELDRAQSKSGSLVVMDATNGAIKAMANYPTYNPNEYYKVDDPSVFNNAVASAPLEIGSVMKPLTMAAALNVGSVTKDQTYYDPSHWQIGDATVTNIEEDGGPGTKSLKDILQLSLNTGAVWLLKQMGGGDINDKARTTWYDYMVNHYHFGRSTGVEQGYEADGIVPDPTNGYGLDIQYANTSFGQGLNITPMQLAAAYSAMLNGGTYYKPRLIDAYVDQNGNQQPVSPTIWKTNIVKPDVSQTLRDFMVYTLGKNHYAPTPAGYMIGGKTGTAQITKPTGGYFEDKYNGMFVGFVGINSPKYVVVVRVNEPHIPGYAGSHAAAPVFSDVSQMLVNNFPLSP